MRALISSLFVISVFTPLHGVFANVRINEIVWQGYLGDANNEWIELYNSGSESVNLDGWLIEAGDGTPSINLSGLSISGLGFILLERTDDTTVPEVTADKFYSGALGNEGETLTLTNADGQILDTVSGWGDMQSTSTGSYSFINGSWKEASTTPRAENTGAVAGNDEDNAGEENTSPSSQSSATKQTEEKKPSYKDRLLTITAPTQAVPGVPVTFQSHIRDYDGDTLKRGLYMWNMGDGTIVLRTNDDSFTHVYQHPGEYVVFVSYNKSTFGKEPDELEPDVFRDHVITVSDAGVEIVSIVDGGTITLQNKTSFTINLEDWILTNNEQYFKVPKNTFVRAGKKVTFSQEITGIQHNPLFVINPSGVIVASASAESLTLSSPDTKTNVAASVQVSAHDEDLELVQEYVTDSEPNKELVLSSSVGASHGSQTTLLVLLLVSLGVLVGALLWILMAHKPRKQTIEGYELIED